MISKNLNFFFLRLEITTMNIPYHLKLLNVSKRWNWIFFLCILDNLSVYFCSFLLLTVVLLDLFDWFLYTEFDVQFNCQTKMIWLTKYHFNLKYCIFFKEGFYEIKHIIIFNNIDLHYCRSYWHCGSGRR